MAYNFADIFAQGLYAGYARAQQERERQDMAAYREGVLNLQEKDLAERIRATKAEEDMRTKNYELLVRKQEFDEGGYTTLDEESAKILGLKAGTRLSNDQFQEAMYRSEKVTIPGSITGRGDITVDRALAPSAVNTYGQLRSASIYAGAQRDARAAATPNVANLRSRASELSRYITTLTSYVNDPNSDPDTKSEYLTAIRFAQNELGQIAATPGIGDISSAWAQPAQPAQAPPPPPPPQGGGALGEYVFQRSFAPASSTYTPVNMQNGPRVAPIEDEARRIAIRNRLRTTAPELW